MVQYIIIIIVKNAKRNKLKNNNLQLKSEFLEVSSLYTEAKLNQSKLYNMFLPLLVKKDKINTEVFQLSYITKQITLAFFCLKNIKRSLK